MGRVEALIFTPKTPLWLRRRQQFPCICCLPACRADKGLVGCGSINTAPGLHGHPLHIKSYSSPSCSLRVVAGFSAVSGPCCCW